VIGNPLQGKANGEVRAGTMSEKGKNKDVRKCPWCGAEGKPETNLLKNAHGEVRERRCSHCGKVLAAYLEEEGEFMPKTRAF
jgi:NAD-dependent SIR2 family protein deacetylase